MKRTKLALLAVVAALSALPYTVMAAVDTAPIEAVKADAALIGTAVLGVLVAIFAIKILRKAL